MHGMTVCSLNNVHYQYVLLASLYRERPWSLTIWLFDNALSSIAVVHTFKTIKYWIYQCSYKFQSNYKFHKYTNWNSSLLVFVNAKVCLNTKVEMMWPPIGPHFVLIKYFNRYNNPSLDDSSTFLYPIKCSLI